MTEQTTSTPADRAARERWVRKARGGITRYRAMAWVTGTLLLVLCVEMLLKYAFDAPDGVMRWLGWIPFAHGWVYVVYLVTVFDLWATMRWRLGRLVTMALAGVVPVMSFVLERRVHAQAQARVAALAAEPDAAA